MITKSRSTNSVRTLLLGAGAALAFAAVLPTSASAQSDDRVRQLEAEVRALQRAVFPGGDGRFFEPEITPSQPTQPTSQVGTPADGAMTDMLARLSAIESQLARLTAATEVNTNAMDLLNGRVDALENNQVAAAQPSGLIPVPGTSSPASGAPASGGELAPARTQAPAQAAQDSDLPSPSAAPATASAATGGPTPARLAAVQAIAKPATGDIGDDEYTYGYRLWDAGFYPEAEQQLALYLERYPNHPRASFGRNLLGRAYLDAGNARTAANYFLENYQADKQGARAPDSLLYLSEAMIALNDTSRACIALAEFGDTYPALATGRLQQQYDANRGKVDCN